MSHDVRPWVEAFAPATVSNLGPGFDCLGLALRERGDTVRARKGDTRGVTILRIEGDGGRLPTDPTLNTAAVAVQHVLDRFAPNAAVELELIKGLPLGSGLGSSGASASAAVVAADAALQLGLPVEALVEAARHAEGVACGTPHPDNVAPALVGGVVLIPSVEPLRLVSLPSPEGLWVTVYTPGCEVKTADARAVLPKAVSVADTVAEPARARLIPGYVDAKAACCEAGALCCSISGAGPTTFALSEDKRRADALLEILEEQYTLAGVPGKGLVDRVGPGARVTSTPLH